MSLVYFNFSKIPCYIRGAFNTKAFQEITRNYSVEDTKDSISKRISFDLIAMRQNSLIIVQIAFFAAASMLVMAVGFQRALPTIIIYFSYELLYMIVCGFALDCVRNDEFDIKFWRILTRIMRIGAVFQNDICFFYAMLYVDTGVLPLLTIVWASAIITLSTSYYTSNMLAFLLLSLQTCIFFYAIKLNLGQSFGLNQSDTMQFAVSASIIVLICGFIAVMNFRRLYFLGLNDIIQLSKERAMVEHKNAQVQRERNLSDAMINRISQAVLLLDTDDTILRANQAAKNLFFIHPDQIGKISMHNFLPDQALSHSEKGYLHNIDEEKFIVQSSDLSPEYEPFAKVVALIDVTSQVLEQENTAQMQKMVAVGALSSGIAHDFNNVLAVIRTNADLIRMSSNDYKVVNESADEIQALTQSGSALTRQLLSYARESLFKSERVLASKVINTVHSFAGRLIGIDHSIEIDVVGDCYLETDIQLLENALLNLVLNARDSMAEGGLIVLRLKLSKNQAVYSVIDEGVGISKEELKRIKLPFVTSKVQGDNVGLGLTMVNKFVDQANGQLVIKSEVGVGTQVSIHLPIEQQAETIIEDFAAAISKPEISPSENILIIDDNENLAKGLAKLLTAHGYNADWCTGSQTLQKFGDLSQFNIVFCDVLLNSETGLDIFEIFQSQNAKARFVFMSGNFPEHLMKLIDGIDNVMTLNKPVSSSVLLEVIHSMRLTI